MVGLKNKGAKFAILVQAYWYKYLSPGSEARGKWRTCWAIMEA